MKTIFILVLGMMLSAPSMASNWSCSDCQVQSNSSGREINSRYFVYYKGEVYSIVKRTTSGECLFAKRFDSKCGSMSPAKFSCSKLMCRANYCIYDRFFNGRFYDRKTFLLRGEALAAYENDSYCK